jgi:hypothetical protein
MDTSPQFAIVKAEADLLRTGQLAAEVLDLPLQRVRVGLGGLVVG